MTLFYYYTVVYTPLSRCRYENIGIRRTHQPVSHNNNNNITCVQCMFVQCVWRMSVFKI